MILFWEQEIFVEQYSYKWPQCHTQFEDDLFWWLKIKLIEYFLLFRITSISFYEEYVRESKKSMTQIFTFGQKLDVTCAGE